MQPHTAMVTQTHALLKTLNLSSIDWFPYTNANEMQMPTHTKLTHTMLTMEMHLHQCEVRMRQNESQMFYRTGNPFIQR